MVTIKVQNQADLLAALKVAKGGDTILLANGNYGAVTLTHDFASKVTLKAVTEGGAIFDTVKLSGVTNLALDGITSNKNLAIEMGSKNVTVLNTDVKGGIYARDVNGLKIDNVETSGGQFGVLFNSVQNFSLTNSHIHDSVEDLMRITGNSYNGTIENNVVANTTGGKPLHPDIIQFFAAKGVTPHDITIRGNLLYDHTEAGKPPAQGIFLSDPGAGGYKNILIEDNMIRTNSVNTIYINGGQENVVVRGNTLIPGLGDGGAMIRLAQKSGLDNSGTLVEGNIAKLLVDETKSSDLVNNHIYGRDADLAKLFSGTDYTSWKSYVPKEGSAIDFGSDFGAQTRFLSLLKEAAAPDQSAVTAIKPVVPIAADAVPAAPVIEAPVYKQAAVAELKGWGADYIKIGHTDDMEIDTGSISVTFNADQTTWKRGILSKDSLGVGDAVSAWIDKGRLMVQFQDGEKSINFSKAGIEAGRDYKLLLTFDEEKVKVWLDGSLVGEAKADIDLSKNGNDLLIGAFNGNSLAGTTSAVRDLFDGTISDLAIHGDVLTPAELAALDNDAHAGSLGAVQGMPHSIGSMIS